MTRKTATDLLMDETRSQSFLKAAKPMVNCSLARSQRDALNRLHVVWNAASKIHRELSQYYPRFPYSLFGTWYDSDTLLENTYTAGTLFSSVYVVVQSLARKSTGRATSALPRPVKLSSTNCVQMPSIKTSKRQCGVE